MICYVEIVDNKNAYLEIGGGGAHKKALLFCILFWRIVCDVVFLLLDLKLVRTYKNVISVGMQVYSNEKSVMEMELIRGTSASVGVGRKDKVIDIDVM